MSKRTRRRVPSSGARVAVVTAVLACIAAALTVLVALLQLAGASLAH
jgi:hypothetical protein